MKKILKNKLVLCLASAIIVSFILSMLMASGFLRDQSDRLSDTLYYEEKPFPDILVIVIDDKSINEIGRSPWPRTVFSNLLDKVKDAKVIGIDVSFLEAESPSEDLALQNSLDALK